VINSWQRWGRVGEPGQNNGMDSFSDVTQAIKAFEKKFKDKTNNDWKNREKFVSRPGKYDLIEMDLSEQKQEPAASSTNQV
jgi:poly [ADP-ribose] polymerase